MNPYSNDLRLRAVMAYERGEGSLSELARRYEVNEDTLGSWCRRYRRTGSIAPLPHSGASKPILSEEDRQHVLQCIVERNDATLVELSEDLSIRRDVHVGPTTIGNLLRESGITRKKRPYVQPNAKRSSGGQKRKPTNVK